MQSQKNNKHTRLVWGGGSVTITLITNFIDKCYQKEARVVVVHVVNFKGAGWLD